MSGHPARLADQVRRHRRHRVRRRVEDDRERCAEQLHQKPGHGRPCRRGQVEIEQCGAVGPHQVRTRHERRHQRLGRRVGQQRQQSGQYGDDVQLPDLQRAKSSNHRDRTEQHQAAEVRPDQHPPQRPPVHPNASRQPEDQVRRNGQRRQQAHLHSRGVQCHHSDQRERDGGDRAPRCRHQLPDPQLPELASDDPSHAEQPVTEQSRPTTPVRPQQSLFTARELRR